MADVKISGLPASSTPLAGTEVLPIVQGGVTDQVSVANLTAGRAVSALSILTTKDTTVSSAQGAIAYGTLGYLDVNHLATFQTSVSSYAQVEIQNTSSNAAASADMIVGNNLTTSSTYYGDFGMNSSGWAGSGAFNTANTVYLTATSGDLALGTTTSNAIHFVISGSTSDAMVIDTSSNVGIGTNTPISKLSVLGNILVPYPSADGSSYTIGIQDATTNVYNNTKRGSLKIQASSAISGADGMGGGDLTLAAGNSYHSGPAQDGSVNIISGYNTLGSSGGSVTFTTNNTLRATLFASGGLSIGNTTDPGAANLNVSGTILTKGYLVANLPTGVTGARAYVTNALSPVFGSIVVTGGAVTVPVFYNGTNWIVG